VAAFSSPAHDGVDMSLRFVALALALALAACSSPAKPVASSTSSGGSDSKLGNHGAVCGLGSRHESSSDAPAPVECSAGLQCCYPCGIDGCDDVCMTPDECNEKRP
jgi:hypothetical protein